MNELAYLVCPRKALAVAVSPAEGAQPLHLRLAEANLETEAVGNHAVD